MIEVPLQPLPNQELIMILDGQNVTIHVYQRGEGEDAHMYLDITVGSSIVQYGAPLIPRVGILSTPNSFNGQFRLVDTASKPDWQTNPVYTELGMGVNKARYRLYFLSASEEQEVNDTYIVKCEQVALAALNEGTAKPSDTQSSAGGEEHA